MFTETGVTLLSQAEEPAGPLLNCLRRRNIAAAPPDWPTLLEAGENPGGVGVGSEIARNRFKVTKCLPSPLFHSKAPHLMKYFGMGGDKQEAMFVFPATLQPRAN